MKLQSIYKFIFNYKYREMVKCNLGFYDSMEDEKYLRKLYKLKTGLELNLDSPKRFNEKLQWLKLYDRNDIYTVMVDKFLVKEYVDKLIGEGHTAKTIGVYDCFEDIDFDSLPEKFVIKTTHGCGGMYIHRGGEINKKMARKKVMSTFSKNYYFHTREWPYKGVKPRILIEEYLQNEDEENLTVYKVLCFEGQARIIQVIQDDKTPNESIDYFDTEWNLLDLKQNYPNSQNHIKRPDQLEEILRLSNICSNGIHFLRTDWYVVNGKIYFSEFTFFSDAGLEKFYPDSWDEVLGDWINLTR
ncbi:ATP-grasp fold amidoligase family protein [Oribacterium sp. P9]|uniref:ATP-grasp fold amidoligase family protein n=1 Tax=Oribacterium sp. P9 TaxID=3378068 RepID=UPI003967DCC7